jgi:hypothetical protein
MKSSFVTMRHLLLLLMIFQLQQTLSASTAFVNVCINENAATAMSSASSAGARARSYKPFAPSFCSQISARRRMIHVSRSESRGSSLLILSRGFNPPYRESILLRGDALVGDARDDEDDEVILAREKTAAAVKQVIPEVGVREQSLEERKNEQEQIAWSSPSSSPSSILSRVKGVFRKREKKEGEKKVSIAKMGMAMFLSYGFVSNMSYAVSLSLAFFIYGKTKGVTPFIRTTNGSVFPATLDASFALVYGGFYVANNFLRPLRIAFSAYVSKYFDAVIAYIQQTLQLPKPVAIFATVVLFNICGTLLASAIGISIAGAACGVSFWPPRSI